MDNNLTKYTMKNQVLPFLTLLMIICLSSCNSNNNNANIDSDKLLDSQQSALPEVKTGNFYTTDLDKSKCVVLADTIVYYTVIKNPDPEDNWQEKCLSRLDRKALANIIFNAIYNERLTAYNFMTDEPMTIEEVKLMEKDHPRKDIAKMEFSEEWYFNENDLSFSKKVNAIMLGYEGSNLSGEIKYYAGVKVYLDKNKKNAEKKESL